MVRLKIIQREGDKYTLTNDAFKKIRNEMKKEREYEKLKSNVNRDKVLCQEIQMFERTRMEDTRIERQISTSHCVEMRGQGFQRSRT